MGKSEEKFWRILGISSSIFSWIILLIIGVLVDRARPPMGTFLNTVKDLPVRQTWDYTLLDYSFYLMVFLLLFSIFCSLINMILWKLKKDALRISPIFLSICSVINLSVYFYNF